MWSNQRAMTTASDSGSSRWPVRADPARSVNTTVTVLRAGRLAAPAAGSCDPQFRQKLARAGFGSPQTGQTVTPRPRRRPGPGQPRVRASSARASRSIRSPGTAATRQGVTARRVAVRRPPSSRATSPTTAPGPSSVTVTPSISTASSPSNSR